MTYLRLIKAVKTAAASPSYLFGVSESFSFCNILISDYHSFCRWLTMATVAGVLRNVPGLASRMLGAQALGGASRWENVFCNSTQLTQSYYITQKSFSLDSWKNVNILSNSIGTIHFSLHTGSVALGSHHWYPDKEFMRLYEGKTLMYADPARRKNVNIPDAILEAKPDSPIPEEAKQDDFYIGPEKYNPQMLPHTGRVPQPER